MIYLKTYENYQLPPNWDANKKINEDTLYELIIICNNNEDHLKVQQYILNKGIPWINNSKTLHDYYTHAICVSYWWNHDLYTMFTQNFNEVLDGSNTYDRVLKYYNKSESINLIEINTSKKLLSGECDYFFNPINIKSKVEGEKLGLL